MKGLFKKWLALCLAVLIFAAPNMHVFAQEPTARNLSVFRVEGDDAFLTWGLGGRGMEPRSGQRLSAGNVMSTGFDTQVYMQLDADSIVKMDEQTQVTVNAAGNRLSLSVSSGSALIEVAQQAPGHILDTRIGSTVMSVRGTLFIAGMRESGAAVFTMLSGEGVVYVADETGAVVVEQPLRAGYVFWAYDYVVPEDFAILPVDLQTMNLFELRETWNYREYLLEIGTITPAMQQQLPLMIDLRETERVEERTVWGVPVVHVPAPTPDPIPAPVPDVMPLPPGADGMRPPIPTMVWGVGDTIVSAITNTPVPDALRMVPHVIGMSLAISPRIFAENILGTSPFWDSSTQIMTIMGQNASGAWVELAVRGGDPVAVVTVDGIGMVFDIGTLLDMQAGAITPVMMEGMLYVPVRLMFEVFEVPFRFESEPQPRLFIN